MTKKNLFLLHYLWDLIQLQDGYFPPQAVFQAPQLGCYIHKAAEINQNIYCFNCLVINKRNMNTSLFLRDFVNYFLKPGGRNITSSAIKFKRMWIWAPNHSLQRAFCPFYSLKTMCQTNAALQKSLHKFPCCQLKRKAFQHGAGHKHTWKYLIKWDSRDLSEMCNSIE